jgi:hypothetical protein
LEPEVSIKPWVSYGKPNDRGTWTDRIPIEVGDIPRAAEIAAQCDVYDNATGTRLKFRGVGRLSVPSNIAFLLFESDPPVHSRFFIPAKPF